MSISDISVKINGKDYFILPVGFVEALLLHAYNNCIQESEKKSWTKIAAEMYRFSYRKNYTIKDKVLITPTLLQILKKKFDSQEDDIGGELPF